MTDVEQRPYLTLHEAAQRLQVSVDDCYRMVRTGELPYVRVGRSIRIPFYAVEGLLSVTRGSIAQGSNAAQAGNAAPATNGQATNGHAHGSPVEEETDEASTQMAGVPAYPTPHPVMDDAPHLPQPPAAQPPEAQAAVPFAPPAAAQPTESATINPLASPAAAQAPAGPQPRHGGLRDRLLPRLKAALSRANNTRLHVPFRAPASAAIAVSDSNLRAIVVRNRTVRNWATVGLKDGVVRDGQITDAEAFMTALAALEAKLAGQRLVGRPIGVVVSGRNLVIGRFQAAISHTGTDRDAMRRLVCEKLSVRVEDVMVDYHVEGSGQDRPAHRGKDAKDAPAPEPVEVFGIAALRSVLDSALRPVTSAGSRVTIAQPKAVALAAAAGVSTGIIVDLEPTSIAVIIVRTGLAEVVRDVVISSELRPPQVAQILAGQVNRSVGYYNARYPNDHLDQGTPIFVTGEGVVEPLAIDLALATLPYPRQSITCPFGASDDFQPGVYAAALGTVRQELLRRSGHPAPEQLPVFDFLPDEFKPRPFPVKTLLAASAAAVLLTGGVPAYQALASVSSQVDALESSVGRLEPQVRLRTLQLRKIAAVQEQIKTTNQAIDKLVASERAVKGVDKAFAVTLDSIRRVVPDGVKLGEMDDDGGLVQVAASAAEPDALFAFVRALSTIEGFGDVRIKSIALSPAGVTASIRVSRDAELLSAIATATADAPADK